MRGDSNDETRLDDTRCRQAQRDYATVAMADGADQKYKGLGLHAMLVDKGLAAIVVGGPDELELGNIGTIDSAGVGSIE